MNLSLLYEQNDPVLIAVVLILLAMSIATWTIWLGHLINHLLVKRSNDKFAKQLFNNGLSYNGASLNSSASLAKISRALIEEIDDYQHNPSQLQKRLNLDELIKRLLEAALASSMYKFERGLSLLASVATTAPFIGLFGTVWGIYHALINISVQGQMSIAAVAGPIGEALIATAIGLFVAIPAVIAYNSALRMNKKLRQHSADFCQRLHLLALKEVEL